MSNTASSVKLEINSNLALGVSYKIAYCLPVFRPPDTTDTSILLQMSLVKKLEDGGHALTLVAPKDLANVICTQDFNNPELANRTWSQTSLFTLTSKIAWHLQQLLGIPYLNVFSNLCLYDACLQCLPGHDIVQERIGLYKMGVAMACRQLELPYVLFFDADDLLEHDLFGKPLEGILRWRAAQVIRYNLATAARIICVSELAKTHLMNTWNVPSPKIAVFPNAVDVNRFYPQPEIRKKIKAQLGFADHPLVVFVGSFFPYQDIKGLLQAYVKVLDKYPRVRLLLVGEGEQYAEMVQYAKTLGLDGLTKFAGFLPNAEIPSIISAADMAVAPYAPIDENKFLGSSMKLVEYMASGVAVIATDNGQIRQVIRDGKNGLMVPAGNVDALVNAMLTLINNPQLGKELGQQARQDVIQEYSWDAYTARLENLYTSVLAEHNQKRFN